MNQIKILECFRRYIAIKLHFNSEAFTWCPGKELHKIQASALEKRNDYHYFDRFAYMIKESREQEQYFISVFLNKPDAWIGEMFETEFKDAHRKRMIKIGSLNYTFGSEVDNIIDYMLDSKLNIKDLFLTTEDAPAIIRDRSKIIGGVSDETLAILDKAFNYTSKRNTNDPLWNQTALKLYKYRSCLNVDKQLLIRNLDKLTSIKAPVELKQPVCA